LDVGELQACPLRTTAQSCPYSIMNKKYSSSFRLSRSQGRIQMGGTGGHVSPPNPWPEEVVRSVGRRNTTRPKFGLVILLLHPYDAPKPPSRLPSSATQVQCAPPKTIVWIRPWSVLVIFVTVSFSSNNFTVVDQPWSVCVD